MLNSSQTILHRNDSSDKVQRLTRLVLLLMCTFFIPWGAGLQNVANVNLSKIFPLCAVALIAYWLLFVRYKFRVFPLYFNYFILFVILHSFVTYVFVYPEELTFGYVDQIALGGDFVRLTESRGLGLARFLLFATFAYAYASLIRTPKELVWLCLAYGLGFLTSILPGSYISVTGHGTLYRSTGGFLNPNSLGSAAMVCIFLSAFVLQSRQTGRWLKGLSLGLIFVGLFGLLTSVSRTPILGLCAGLVVMLYYLPFSRKIGSLIVVLLITITVLTVLPESTVGTLKSRMTVLSVIESRGAKRQDIWSDYLRQLPQYALAGVGLKRAVEVTKDCYTTFRPYIPHSTYLSVLVELGGFGLLLFLGALWQFRRRIGASRSRGKTFSANPVMMGFLVAWACYFLMGSMGQREFWLSWAILAVYGSWNIKWDNAEVRRHPRGAESVGEIVTT